MFIAIPVRITADDKCGVTAEIPCLGIVTEADSFNELNNNLNECISLVTEELSAQEVVNLVNSSIIDKSEKSIVVVMQFTFEI